MKFTCTKEQIDRAIRYSIKAVSKKSTLPITQNISFIAEDNKLRCVATDLDVGVRIDVSCKVEENGAIVLAPQLLTSFVSAMNDNTQITIFTKEHDTIVFVSDKTTAVVKGFDSTDFPIIPEIKDEKFSVKIDTNEFHKGVSRVIISVAKTEARPELTGVNFCFSDKKIHVAATDGFRLSESILDIKKTNTIDDNTSCIIPISTINEVLYILSDSNVKQITLRLSDGQIFFDVGDISVASRLITGTYPEYQQIIPTENKTSIIIDRSVWEKSLRLADVFANQTTSDMKLIINPNDGKGVVHAISQERGENTAILDLDGHGDEQEIFLNIRYVIDGIHRCGGDKVKILFSGATSPIVVVPESDEKFLYLVMPIRK